MHRSSSVSRSNVKTWPDTMSVALSSTSALPGPVSAPIGALVCSRSSIISCSRSTRVLFSSCSEIQVAGFSALLEPADAVVFLYAVQERRGMGRAVEAKICGVYAAARHRGDDGDIRRQWPHLAAGGVADVVQPPDDRRAEGRGT